VTINSQILRVVTDTPKPDFYESQIIKEVQDHQAKMILNEKLKRKRALKLSAKPKSIGEFREPFKPK